MYGDHISSTRGFDNDVILRKGHLSYRTSNLRDDCPRIMEDPVPEGADAVALQAGGLEHIAVGVVLTLQDYEVQVNLHNVHEVQIDLTNAYEVQDNIYNVH